MMAETVGSLIDKITIARIRTHKAKEYGRFDMHESANNQRIALQNELDSLINNIKLGIAKNPVEEKLKLYKGQADNELSIRTFGQLISDLFDANLKLWELEDFRRDKNNSDSDRLCACDEVSQYNKDRNKCIDEINLIMCD